MQKIKKFEFINNDRRKILLHKGNVVEDIGFDFIDNGNTLRIFIKQKQKSISEELKS